MNDGSVAYWSAGIVPAPIEEHRLPADRRHLVELVLERGVALRGWNYPHVPRDDPPQGVVSLPDGGIEATTATGQYQEVWRLHPNGLFTHRWRPREDGTGYRGTIHLLAAINTMTEVFEFGRRGAPTCSQGLTPTYGPRLTSFCGGRASVPQLARSSEISCSARSVPRAACRARYWTAWSMSYQRP